MSKIRFVLLFGVISLAIASDDLPRKLAKLYSHAIRKSSESREFESLSSEILSEDLEDWELRASRIEPNEAPPMVSTTSGMVTGSYDTNVQTFYEIPYAKPPVGELRFQPPQEIVNKKAIDATTNNELRCMQFEKNCVLEQTSILCNRINMAEDCLVLNIYVPNQVNLSNPNKSPTDSLPVMLYVHGGSFNEGSGYGMDGRELAYAANVILVTINYRLGPFGFLVHKETGKPNIDGNQGIKDQQMALKWIYANIANFGGNKDMITIFGGSAGSQSVMFHSLSAVSAPYYSRAIQQSTPAYIEFDTPEESQRITNSLARRVCNQTESTYDCLMNADPIDLANRQLPVMARNFFASDMYGLAEPFRPVIDGSEYTAQPLTLYKEGKWNSNKTMIVGVQTQELEDIQFYIPLFVPTGKAAMTIATYYLLGIGTTDKVVTKYTETYPADDGDYVVMFGKEMSHLFFICPSRALARFASKTTTGDANVYFYANEHPVVDGTCKSRNNGSVEGCYYATHDDETRFVLRRLSNPSEPDRAVQDMFSTYWGSFARTGSPNNGLETSLGDFTEWPTYSEDEVDGTWRNIRIKAPMSAVETGYEEDICDFWDSLGIYMDPVPLSVSSTTPQKVVTDPPIVEDTTSSSIRLFEWNFLHFLLPLFSYINCTF